MKSALLVSTLAASLLLASCGRLSDQAPPPTRLQPAVHVDSRAPSQCLAFVGDDSPARLERAFPALQFGELTQMTLHPTAPYVYVVEQTGRVLRFVEDDATSSAEVVLDLADQLHVVTWEMGLLGFVLRPDYDQNPEAFVKYTTQGPSGEPILRVARVRGDAEGRHFDLATAEVLFDLRNDEGYHHGGAPAFGPDGKLYVPFGDGGFATSEAAQDYASVRGTIVRLDVATRPYGVPDDNPFVGAALSAGETFATGFRNPFGFSFDSRDGSLWVGDVGESAYEELDHVHAGDNHGWPAFEAFACRDPARCATGGYASPAYAYGHEEGLTIVGGPVYRGEVLPAVRGQVLFSDFFTGRLQAFDPESRRVVTLIEGGNNPVAFTEGRDHEVFVVGRGGAMFRLRANPGTSRAPRWLSETGCMSQSDPSRFADGLVPFTVNMPLWSDGADKDRAFALPFGDMITAQEDGTLALPTGSLVLKTFRRAGLPLETRILANHEGIGWRGYSYAWREDGTDAELLETGERRTIHGESWQYPSRGQCFTCHSDAAGVRGLELSQLERNTAYGDPPVLASQLGSLRGSGVLDDHGVSATPYPDSSRTSSVSAWSRAYLDVNCAGCHRPMGPGGVAFDLRAEATPDAFCDLPASIYVPGMNTDLKIVAPGAPERSALLQRMESTDPQRRMPPLASHLVDAAAVAVIRTWIAGMKSCE